MNSALRFRICAGTVLVMAMSAGSAWAQNFASSGQSWSGSWGFSSATDRSLALQQAQVLRQAEGGNSNPQAVYNNYYDNRNNYVDAYSENGDVTTDYQIGDEIGENTYSVGSLNTGNTTVSVEGDNNLVDSVNSAETDGCVDGSINSLPSIGDTPSTYLPVVRSCE